jgi:galactokinase
MVRKDDFFADLPALRAEYGDRAALRALHYFEENDRVENQRAAIKRGDYAEFFRLLQRSGDSSFKYLQNVFCAENATDQGLSVALALCDCRGITARVHGGGFAGTVQAWPAPDQEEVLKQDMEHVFGKGCCLFLKIRPYGAICVTRELCAEAQA